MNALQQSKQKGRTLRKLLAQAFGTDVTLSQAYELIAGMEGHADWNTFSAHLASGAATPKAPAKAASGLAALPTIKAIFRTADGKAEARFDASFWFVQASSADIRTLKEEKPRFAPVGFELSYGGKNGVSDTVAEFCANSHPEVRAVYDYIAACADANVDCGGSDCYIDAHDVQRWLVARDKDNVLESQLGHPDNAKVLAGICKAAWEYAVADWQRQVDSGAACEYIIEHSFIFAALGDSNVISTDPEEGYSDETAELVDDALQDEGYYLQARRLFKGLAKLSDPYPLTYDTFKVVEVMMEDVVGYYEEPGEVPEWDWVQNNASFKHLANGTDGVWEFMVNVECHECDPTLPERLRPLFEKARKERAPWVMFHQGT